MVVLISHVWWHWAPWQLWDMGSWRADGMKNWPAHLFDSLTGISSGSDCELFCLPPVFAGRLGQTLPAYSAYT